MSHVLAVSNVVDAHNQARQFQLRLEKRWVTRDCWFRLDSTFIGITVTDAWKAHRNAAVGASPLTILEFADRLSYDLHLKATILQVPSNFLLWNTFSSITTTVFVQK